MEFGCYESDGFAKIDINNNKDEETVSLTAFHESIHKLLSENSNYGLIICLIRHILNSDCLDKSVKNKLCNLHNILLKKTLQVQESTAVFAELCLAKRMDIKLFEKKLQEYRSENFYYNKCKFKNIEELLYYVPVEEAFKLIFETASAAMNVDLNYLDITNKKLEKLLDGNELGLCINPNTRFKNLIKEIKKIGIGNSISTLDKIKESLSITDIRMSNEDFKNWASEKILLPFSLLEFDEYMILKKGTLRDTYIQSLTPYVSDVCYKRILCKSESDFIEKNNINNILYITKYFNNEYELISADIIKGIMYYFTANKLSNVVKKDQTLFCDRYYYSSVIKENNYLKESFLFINLNSIDDFCKSFVNEHLGKKCFFIQQINDNNFCVFIKGINRTYFMHLFFKDQFKYIYEDFLKGYEYININDINNPVDNIFYMTKQEYNRYDSLLLFILQKTIDQNNCLGNRLDIPR